MTTKSVFLAFFLFTVLSPVYAKCEKILPAYLKDPHVPNPLGPEFIGAQFALVKIVAVHPDAKPPVAWFKTGTLDLVTLESNGKGLPSTFTVSYAQRLGTPTDNGGYTLMLSDCYTWDDVTFKPSARLLGFFYLKNKEWAVPETSSGDVVFNADHLSANARRAIQPLFKTRL